MLLVGVIERIKRVVPRGLLRVGWIDDAQVLEAAGSFDMRQQAMEELSLPFTVEDNHRHLACAEAPRQILRDDVLKKGRFSGPRCRPR
jgi:hypothetical protein